MGANVGSFNLGSLGGFFGRRRWQSFQSVYFWKKNNIWLHQLHNKKKFIRLFLFVNGAGQMSASQNSPKQSKIKSYKFLTFFYCIVDEANNYLFDMICMCQNIFIYINLWNMKTYNLQTKLLLALILYIVLYMTCWFLVGFDKNLICEKCCIYSKVM